MKNPKCLILILFVVCIIILFCMCIVQVFGNTTFKAAWVQNVYAAYKRRAARFAVPQNKITTQTIDLVIIWYCPPPILLPIRNTDDYDELKFLLRSVTAFAPWIYRVHIVVTTDVKNKDLPSWLNLQHPHLNVVNVNKIMPNLNFKSVSPTQPIFNMHAIEACLHRIPSLSEHYVYAHKGMLFGNVTRVSDFFNEDGTIALFVSPVLKRPVTVQDTVGSTYRQAWLHTYTALESVYNSCKLPVYLPCPQITMMSVTLGQHAESTFLVALGCESDAEDTVARPVSLLTPQHAKSADLCANLHTIGLQLYGGLCVGRVAVASRVPTMQYMDWSSEIDSVNKRRLKLIVKTRPQLLCVNNINGSPTNVASWSKFAETYYPVASRFELL